MSNVTPKTSSNPYYQARCKASAHNEALRSREGAADIMAVDRGRLYRIESGITVPYPEEIHLMADLYGAPELRNHFCTTECPLGCQYPKTELKELDRITINALHAFRKIEATRDLLLDITEDGVISEDEQSDLESILKTLEEMETISQNLRLWVQKNRR